MVKERNVHFSRSFIVLLLQLGFPMMSPVIVVQASAATNMCDQYKYSVQYPYQNFCTHCKICPQNNEKKYENGDCKKKIPNYIEGQGYAWCTGEYDKLPSCQLLSVHHGRLNCTSGNGVYSKCTLLCNPGYMPVDKNWTRIECLDSLQWNMPDTSLLGCYRTAKPDKPIVVSHGQRQEVRSGSEKTLSCVLSSEVIGKRKIYWYFKDKQLYSDSDVDTYVIHAANMDNEGKYFCQVEDDNGKSELSAGYFLKVENVYSVLGSSQNFWETPGIIAIGIVSVCIILLAILYKCCIRNAECQKQCATLLYTIIGCKCHKGDDMDNSCLTSVASSVGGYSKASGTSSSTTDSGTSDGESKELCVSKVNSEIKAQETHHLLPTKQEIPSGDPLDKDDIGAEEITEKDRNDLRLVLQDWTIIKNLRILLDQKAGTYEDKPTFHCLGRYLGDSADKIANFEFNCQHMGNSPTELYIRRMTEQGQGLSILLRFLKQYKHTQTHAEDIENKVSHKHARFL